MSSARADTAKTGRQTNQHLESAVAEAEQRYVAANPGSAKFAEQLANWRAADTPALVFIIGGADGLAPSLRDKAKMKLSFGAATWPHQLVRVMLLEQLYRAATILTGHPYHRP